MGLAFVAAGFSSFPIILAVCALTAVVGYNYIIVCSHFPDGGGVYSAARKQSRFLASAGALLLVANFIVTAALSGWAAVSYLGVSSENARLATVGLILVVGIINYFGPRHSGSVSIWLAMPAVLVVILIVAFSGPHLKVAELEPAHSTFTVTWIQFVGVILALSGVEAVANITGVMKLDPDSSPERPKVTRTATKAIVPVAIEVVFGTALLGWAMLSLPKFFATAVGRSQRGHVALPRGTLRRGRDSTLVWNCVRNRSRYCLRSFAFQRGEHRGRSADRCGLHDGPGRRNAATIGASESPRRSATSACSPRLRFRFSFSR